MLMSMAACGDKDNNRQLPTGGDTTATEEETDTVSGSTRPADEEEPDTISGSTRSAEGDIKKGTIGYGSFTLDGQTQQGAYGIDFNRDGVLEYRIDSDAMSLTYNASDNNIVVLSGYIATMAKHSAINSSCNFAGDGHTPLPALGSLPEKFYVGCRFMLADGLHYGWVKVEYEDDGLEWDKCAYNTAPNRPVTAGDD